MKVSFRTEQQVDGRWTAECIESEIPRLVQYGDTEIEVLRNIMELELEFMEEVRAERK